MAAAYLAGSRGRPRDAVVLGIAATASHTASVFAAGIAIHLALRAGTSLGPAALRNRITVATSILSGLVLLGMGLVLFFRRWSFAGDPHAMEHYFHHEHHHQPGHGSDHGHDPGTGTAAEGSAPAAAPPSPARASLAGLIGLGASGGMVPCPAGIFVILLGLLHGRLLFSLVLLVFFSLALGAVLVGIGLLIVKGSPLLKRRLDPKLASYLPALSALLIAGIGTFFSVRAFLAHRTEVAGILESLAAAIRS